MKKFKGKTYEGVEIVGDYVNYRLAQGCFIGILSDSGKHEVRVDASTIEGFEVDANESKGH